MADKTPKKPRKLLNGNEDGIPFSKDNQPSPEAKSKGWQRVRAERHFTQEILRQMGLINGDGKPFVEYIRQVAVLAKNGNAEALKQVRQAIEDEVSKIDITTDGEKVQQQVIVLPNGATIPIG